MVNLAEMREQRIRVFEHHLELMVQRRGQERSRDCAIIFSEDRPEEDGAPVLKAKAARRVFAMAGGPAREESPPGGGGRPEGCARFVQFAFMARSFYMDLPRPMFAPEEASRLERQRHGFFRLRYRRWWFQAYPDWQDVVKRYDPLEKEYLNVDTRSAAEDMAYVWYSFWRFPLESRLYWRAFRFRAKTSRPWEGAGDC